MAASVPASADRPGRHRVVDVATADDQEAAMKIVDLQTTVVGTPWRELTFLELETDSGLVGLGEVRMVNKTDTLLACIHELAPGTSSAPTLRRRAAGVEHPGRRVRPTRRGRHVGAGRL
jgi:L-alanine-DL-glutamate epimerase-like enolase superfamily enzyme